MNTELFGKHKNESFSNRSQYYRIVLLSIVTIALFFVFEILRPYVPENLFQQKNIEIKSIGLLIIGIVMINSMLIPRILNTLTPKLSIFKLVGITGLIIFVIECLFKLIQSLIVGQDRVDVSILKGAMLISLLSMLIANIYAHKIKNKNTTIPILVLVLSWLSIGYFIKKNIF